MQAPGTSAFYGWGAPPRVALTGRHVRSYGARIGYWPCLQAPFVTLDLGTWRLDVWHGLPSYKEHARNG